MRGTAAGDASDGAVDKPAPDAGEVLVKVLATSVNAADWHCRLG
jgi:NADPH:quinone reductase-like Zn-dependent oxidoreductase